MTTSFIPTVLIRKVQEQKPLLKEEIFALISAFQNQKLPDYQMSALLMAIYYKGLSKQEKIWLTEALMNSGEVLTWEDHPVVDKHSTGGVGDKVSLLLAPLLASLGFKVPMMAGRGLGHTGGTIDKLESLGINTNLSLKDFKNFTLKNEFCIIGQTEEICPADKKLYALRDVTCTVSSIPLITASIVSKKRAEGVKGIVYDVKTGSGAFMKTQEDSISLAQSLVETTQGLGSQAVAVITDMSQPLGRFVGNILEMKECFEILTQPELAFSKYSDTTEVTLVLAARLTEMMRGISYSEAYTQAKDLLHQESTKQVFFDALKQQGWKGQEPHSEAQTFDFKSSQSGYINSMDNEKIGWASVALGAGRMQLDSKIDPHVGFYFHKKVGDSVKEGDTLVTVYFNEKEKLEKSNELLSSAFSFSSQPTKAPQLIQDTIYG